VARVITIDAANVWAPTVLGRGRLSDVWSAYLVKAPFDMPSDAPDLVGSRVILDGEAFTIGGSIQNVPVRPITQGDPIQILVSAL
jgi:hypothetical protein